MLRSTTTLVSDFTARTGPAPRALAARALAAVCCALLMPAIAAAQAPTPAKDAQSQLLEKLVRELQCQPGQKCDPAASRGLSRSLSGAARPASPQTESGRRSLEVDAKSRALPASDVEVYFPYNSAELVAESRRTLDTMAKALKTQQLAGSGFAVVGHTDARGGDTFNQELSERRAKAVREYLASAGGIEAERLAAWGRGKTELKIADDPFAATNRRVQLINTGAKEAAVRPSQPAAQPTQDFTSSGSSTATKPAQPAARPLASDECRRYSPVANATVECERN